MKNESYNNKKKICYLLDSFLTPSTTFITDEIRYLHSNKSTVQVYVLDHCIKSRIDPVNNDLLPLAFFSRPMDVFQAMISHFFVLAKHPIKFIKVLHIIIRLTVSNRHQCARALFHMMEGIYLGKRITDEKINHIHVHFAGRAATAAFVIYNIYGIPYSVTVHAYDLFKAHLSHNRLIRKDFDTRQESFLNLKLSLARNIITISKFNYDILTNKLGIKAECVRIIRCGVDIKKFRREKEQPANAIPIILSVGTLSEKKGHEFLIRACAYLKSQGCQFLCKIVGGGLLLNSLLLLRQSLNLEDNVHLYGPVHHSQIISFFEEADIFVLACLEGKDGNMDGIPVALMEAMAMEIPVVTTSISGIPELVKSGEVGFLVEPANAKALAEKIGQLLQDRQLRQQIGRCGRDKIFNEYNQEINFSLVSNVLTELLRWQNDGHTCEARNR